MANGQKKKTFFELSDAIINSPPFFFIVFVFLFLVTTTAFWDVISSSSYMEIHVVLFIILSLVDCLYLLFMVVTGKYLVQWVERRIAPRTEDSLSVTQPNTFKYHDEKEVTSIANEQKEKTLLELFDAIIHSPPYLFIVFVILFLMTTTLLWNMISWSSYMRIDVFLFSIMDCFFLLLVVVMGKNLIQWVGRRIAPRAEGSLSVTQSVTQPNTSRRLLYYAPEDTAFAQQVSADLQAREIQCKLVQSGTLQEERKRPIVLMRDYDQFLLVLSPDSRANAWTRRLIFTVLFMEEVQKSSMLFLLEVDTITGKDAGVWTFSRYQVHRKEDFTGWEDPAQYQQALELLVNHLKETASVA